MESNPLHLLFGKNRKDVAISRVTPKAHCTWFMQIDRNFLPLLVSSCRIRRRIFRSFLDPEEDEYDRKSFAKNAGSTQPVNKKEVLSCFHFQGLKRESAQNQEKLQFVGNVHIAMLSFDSFGYHTSTSSRLYWRAGWTVPMCLS